MSHQSLHSGCNGFIVIIPWAKSCIDSCRPKGLTCEPNFILKAQNQTCSAMNEKLMSARVMSLPPTKAEIAGAFQAAVDL